MHANDRPHIRLSAPIPAIPLTRALAMTIPTTSNAPETSARNDCGTCTYCCHVMKVKELNKPANTACTHCIEGNGCAIYNDRPVSCRQYECLWLRSQQFDKPLSAGLRPDRCKVVIGTLNQGNDIVLYTEPAHQNAWQQPAFSEALGLFVTRGVPVYISVNDQLTRIV